MHFSQSQGRTIEFDPEQNDTPDSRLEKLAEIRTKCPIAWSEKHGGFWLVSSYEHCDTILNDTEGYTTVKTVDAATGQAKGGNAIPVLPWDRVIPAESESPEWERYRGALAPYFTPKAVNARREHAVEFTNELIDRVIGSGRIDFVTDLGNPLSAVGIMRVLGLSSEDWPRWAHPFHEIIHRESDSQERRDALAGIGWVYEQLGHAVGECRADRHAPGMLSELASDPMGGNPLSDQEIIDLSMQALSGAIETTTSLTANALHYLHGAPAARKELMNNRKLIPRAFDEFLRYFTPVQGLARTVKAEREIGGVSLSPGDRLLMSYVAANHDEQIFECPERVLLDRAPNRHLALGRGQHFCLGSFQARMIFEVILNAIFDRMPDFVVAEQEARRTSIALINGWISLPARFTPGEPKGC